MAIEHVSYDITNKGKEIIARVVGGLQITFKRIAIGDGIDYEIGKFVNKTALVNEVISINELSMNVTSTALVELSGKFAEADVKNPFWYREVGIYIVDPDDETKEILFAYGNRNDAAEYIVPHIQNYSVLKEIKCVTSVGTSANVHVLISATEAGKVDFKASEWTFDEENNIYTLFIGFMTKEGIRVIKTTDSGTTDAAVVEIAKNAAGETILKSLTAIDGYLVCV